MQFSRPALIHNPVGGSATGAMTQALISELSRFADDEALQVYSTGPEPFSARNAARKAVENGADLLIGMGGDGTILEVAEVAISASTAFAAYQAGTGNQFANSFYPRLPAKDFVAMLRSGKPQALDVLELEISHEGKKIQRKALVGVCTGEIARAITGAPRYWKRIFGSLVYFWRVLACCLKPGSQNLTFRSGEKQWQSTVFASVILNVDRTPLLRLAPACNASDGLLDFLEISAGSLFEIAATAFWLLVNRPYKCPHFRHLRISELSIQSDAAEAIHLNIDGEGLEADSLRMRVLKGALQMITSS